MLESFLIQLVIAVVLAVVAYALAPKPKSNQSDATQEMETPTADAGRPIPVVFGDLTVKSPNCLGYDHVSTEIERVKM